MIVDFPEPEGPTNAVVLPASKTQLKFLRTYNSLRVGYVKFTSLKIISQENLLTKKRYLVSRYAKAVRVGV